MMMIFYEGSKLLYYYFSLFKPGVWRVDRKTVLVQVLERGLSSKGGYRVDTVLHSLPRPSDVQLLGLKLPV